LKPKGLFAILPESQDGKSSKHFSRMMIILSAILAALFLYFALRNLDWRIFFVTLKIHLFANRASLE